MRSIGGSFHLLQPVVAALILLVVCLVYALQCSFLSNYFNLSAFVFNQMFLSAGSGTISEFSSDVLFSRAKYSGNNPKSFEVK